MKKIYKVLIWFLTGLSLITACKEDVVINTDDLNPDRPIHLAGPLASTSIYASDLIENMYDSTGSNAPISIKVDTGLIDEGLIYVDYTIDFSYEWDDVVNLGQISQNGSYTPTLTKSTQQEIRDSIKFNLSETQRFDNATLSAGSLNLNIPAVDGVTGTYTVTFPGVSLNGEALHLADGDLSVDYDQSVDLTAYDIAFVHTADSAASSIVIVLDVNVTAITNPSAGIEYSVLIDNLSPLYLDGYFGEIVALNESFDMSFDVFSDLDILENIAFKGSQIEIAYNNYFGVPVSASIKDALFYSGDELIDSLDWKEEIVIESANYSNDEVIPYEAEEHISNSNSNIQEILNQYPNKFAFTGNIVTNPDGETANKNFISDMNRFDAEVMLIFPFWFRTEAFDYTDTLSLGNIEWPEVEEGDLDIFTLIELVELTLRFENAFPFTLNVDIIATNADYSYTDTIVKSGEVLQATDMINGAVDTTNLASTDFVIQIYGDDLIDYREHEVDQLILTSTIATGGEEGEFVKLYDYNYLSTKIMFEIKEADNE